MSLLKHKKFVVTGAGGLLGAELVRSILQFGGAVIATDLDYDRMVGCFTDELRQTHNETLVFEDLDLNDELAVRRFFSRETDIDGAVNASYPKNRAYGNHFFDVKLSDFNENVALHLGSAFLFMQEAARYFKSNPKSFSLVNIASIYGVCTPDFSIYSETSMTMPVEYAAIKSGLLHLNRYVANYVADSRFRVNSVSPGGLLNDQSATFLEKYSSKTHGAGMLDASDISGAVRFLLSDHSKHITGQNLIIDDGFTL